MRIAGIILIVLGLGVFAYWGVSGAHFATQYKVEQKTMEEDDFGDEVEVIKMVDKFQFGLTPDKGPDSALTLGGPPLGLGVVLLLVGLKRGRKEEE